MPPTKKTNQIPKQGQNYPKLVWADKPYALQQDIIDHLDGKKTNPKGNKYRFLLAILGRQTGKSWLGKRVLLDHAANKHENCMWVALTIKNAQAHWHELTTWIEKANFPVKSINNNQKEIYFHGGGYIYVRTAQEPDNMRGTGLKLIVLDEAAFYPKGQYIWNSIIVPMVTSTRGQVLITTTPNVRDYLYDLYLNGLDPDNLYFKSWNIPSSASPYQDKELLEQIRKSTPSSDWRREYLAEFITDAGGVFYGLESASCLQPSKEREPNVVRRVMGVDVGFNKDFTCVTIVDYDSEGVGRQKYGRRWSGEGTADTIAQIAQVIHEYQPDGMVLENNGVGNVLYQTLSEVLRGQSISSREVLQRTLTQQSIDVNVRTLLTKNTKIYSINMDNSLKRRLVETLSADIEYGRMLILAKDCDYGHVQMLELGTYERQITTTARMTTYNARSGEHDDTVSALYLCTFLKPPPVSVSFAEAKPTHRRFFSSNGASTLNKLKR
jgi:phage terminase large subunit-like protein